jgi:hypothetical protein
MAQMLRLAMAMLAVIFSSLTAAPAASVAGMWAGMLSQKQSDGSAQIAPIRFNLTQEDNHISGTAGPEGKSLNPIRDAKLEGNHLTFNVSSVSEDGTPGVTWQFDLTVSEDRIEGKGTATSGSRSWTADVSMSRNK